MSMVQATSIQYQAWLERSIWHTSFAPYVSSLGDWFGMLIRPEYWWHMKWVLNRLTPQLKKHWFANCWLRMCNGVANIHYMREFPWWVGDVGAQWLSHHCQWRIGVVSVPEIDFCAPPLVEEPHTTTPWVSSTCISRWTNYGGYKAQSGRDVHDSHQRDETYNRFQTWQLVAPAKCKSYPWGSEQ